MRYYTCQCGEMESWCSGMEPSPCSGCEKCGTVANWNKSTVVPHEFVAEMVETDDGDHPLSRCKWCYHTKKELEKMKARRDENRHRQT